MRDQILPYFFYIQAPTFWGKLTELSKSMKINLDDGYRTLEAYLSDTAYVADNVLTLADISIYSTVSTMDGIYPVDNKYVIFTLLSKLNSTLTLCITNWLLLEPLSNVIHPCEHGNKFRRAF